MLWKSRSGTCNPNKSVRQKKLSELNSKAQLEERAVEISLRGQGQATVVLTYLLAGASWEPAHELRAEEAGEKINISSYAVVRQSTGEDWGATKLSFSTQNLSRTARIPELDTLLVGQGNKAPVQILQQQEDTYQDALGTIDRKTGFGFTITPSPTSKSPFATSTSMTPSNKKPFVLLPSSASGGHHRPFRGIGRQGVPTDGQPVRIPIGELSLSRTERIVAAPEASLNAARVFELNNQSGQALLPGKVTLYLRSQLPRIHRHRLRQPRRAFPCTPAWRTKSRFPESSIAPKAKSAKTSFSSKTELQASWIIEVENLAGVTKNADLPTVFPRIPNRRRQSALGEDFAKDPPDEKGLFSWDLELAPKKKRTLAVEYIVQYPSDYTQRRFFKDKGAAIVVERRPIRSQSRG